MSQVEEARVERAVLALESRLGGRDPGSGCTTLPSARSTPEASVTGWTKLDFSSIVTGAIGLELR